MYAYCFSATITQLSVPRRFRSARDADIQIVSCRTTMLAGIGTATTPTAAVQLCHAAVVVGVEHER